MAWFCSLSDQLFMRNDINDGEYPGRLNITL